jgi:hypothetical protein
MLQNTELDEQVTRAEDGRHRTIPRAKFRTALRTPAKRRASRRTYSTPIRELLIQRTKGLIPYNEPTNTFARMSTPEWFHQSTEALCRVVESMNPDELSTSMCSCAN